MIETTFKVMCKHCGEELEISKENVGTWNGKIEYELIVYPCNKCMDERYEEGVDKGREDERK